MIHDELVEDGSANVLVLACQLPDDPLQKGEVLKQEVDVRPGLLGHPGVIPGNALPNVAAPELRDGQGALGQDPLVFEPVHPCTVARGGRCLFFLTMQCFNDAMF